MWCAVHVEWSLQRLAAVRKRLHRRCSCNLTHSYHSKHSIHKEPSEALTRPQKHPSQKQSAQQVASRRAARIHRTCKHHVHVGPCTHWMGHMQIDSLHATALACAMIDWTQETESVRCGALACRCTHDTAENTAAPRVLQSRAFPSAHSARSPVAVLPFQTHAHCSLAHPSQRRDIQSPCHLRACPHHQHRCNKTLACAMAQPSHHSDARKKMNRTQSWRMKRPLHKLKNQFKKYQIINKGIFLRSNVSCMQLFIVFKIFCLRVYRRCEYQHV